jgi:cytoskeletal protein CcmA (bactofilin family)
MFEREKGRPEDGSPTNGTTAFLGKGTRIVGKLTFEGAVRIEGQVEGEITADDTLTIGESAVVKAKIAGATVVVHGQVTGDITARARLELRAPSRVVGNINTPSLIIQEGAVFEGQCAMGGSDPARRGNKKTDFSVLLRGDESAEKPLATQLDK